MILWNLWVRLHWRIAKEITRIWEVCCGRWDRWQEVPDALVRSFCMNIVQWAYFTVLAPVMVILLAYLVITLELPLLEAARLMVLLTISEMILIFPSLYLLHKYGPPPLPRFNARVVVSALIQLMLVIPILAAIPYFWWERNLVVHDEKPLEIVKVSHRIVPGTVLTLQDGSTLQIPRRFLVRSGHATIGYSGAGAIISVKNLDPPR